MEHQNRVRKLVPQFRKIDRYLSNISSSLLSVQSAYRELRELFKDAEIENPFKIEERHIERALKQFDKLREILSNFTSTKLSKGHLTDSDAHDLKGFMNTLGVTLEVISWENRVGSSMGKPIEILSAFLSAELHEINLNFTICLLNVLCKQLVEKVWYAVVISAVALLSSVYQYLLGYVLKGETRAYSSGSLDFRDTFVSLLLFQGSYVWIFFRAVAPKKVYRRSRKDEAGRVLCYYGKYEPRFKPHRERQPAGTVLEFNNLPLGGYDSHRDAEIVCQIAGYYYKRDEADIMLRDGSTFTIPPMPEQEQSLFGEDKVRCVVARAKEVFGNFQVKNNAIILPSESNTVSAHDFFQHVVTEEFSLDALLDAADAHPVDWEFADSFGADGGGLEGTPASPSLAEQVVRLQSHDRTVSNDADSMTKQESSVQQLKEQLEAFGRLITEQHLQREKQLEERITKLQLENEKRIAQLQLENELLKCLMH